LMVSLGQGDALRFVVFSDSQGQDGTFDVTAFRLKISGPNAVGGTTSFFMDDSKWTTPIFRLAASRLLSAEWQPPLQYSSAAVGTPGGDD